MNSPSSTMPSGSSASSIVLAGGWVITGAGVSGGAGGGVSGGVMAAGSPRGGSPGGAVVPGGGVLGIVACLSCPALYPTVDPPSYA
jgi:hypothetical protein